EQHDDSVEETGHDQRAGLACAKGRFPYAPDISKPGDRQSYDNGPGASHDENIQHNAYSAAALRSVGEDLGDVADASDQRRKQQRVEAQPEYAKKARDPGEPKDDQIKGSQRFVRC